MTTKKETKTKEVQTKDESKKEVKTAKITKIELSNRFDCFQNRIDSDSHRFCKSILDAPKTMKQIKQLGFKNTYYCKYNQLLSQSLVLKTKNGVMEFSTKGKKMFASWMKEQKALALEAAKETKKQKQA